MLGHLMLGSTKRFIIFNVVVFFVFLITYRFMGMKKHFDVDPTFNNAVYFTTISHATVGYGDISPKTTLAKALVTTHIAIVWIASAFAASWSFETDVKEKFDKIKAALKKA